MTTYQITPHSETGQRLPSVYVTATGRREAAAVYAREHDYQTCHQMTYGSEAEPPAGIRVAFQLVRDEAQHVYGPYIYVG